MILVVDAGNTNIHIGLFTQGALRAQWRFSSDVRRTVDEFQLQFNAILGEEQVLKGAVISSVVPRLTATLRAALENSCAIEPMILDHETPIGIHNNYLHPEEVGTDRLANAVGGVLMHGAPLLILDFGTAITLEHIAATDDPEGLPTYEGGAIMPGLEMAAEALARGTSKLPPVEIIDPGRVIAKTTEQSIQSGLVSGFLGAIQSLVERAFEEIGDRCKLISTGGNARYFKTFMPYVDAVEPELTLYGLRQIWGINHGQPLPPRH